MDPDADLLPEGLDAVPAPSGPQRDPRLDEPCTRPYALVSTETGEIIEMRCGARLTETCPSCAARYQIAARRAMDEGMPAIPADRSIKPAAAFVTLTLPSCGAIKAGSHAPRVPSVYRYGLAVALADAEPDLWRAWRERLRRATRHWEQAGLHVAVRGSREVQERGAGHYHVIVTVSAGDDWDGATPTPTDDELRSLLEGLDSPEVSAREDVKSFLDSPAHHHRRRQFGLDQLPSSPDTYRLNSVMKMGAQRDVRLLTLGTDPKTDPASAGRAASYVSKALGYTVKDLGGPTPATAHQNRRENAAHLDRLRREAAAMLLDVTTTRTVCRWIDRRRADRLAELRDTRSALHQRRPGIYTELNDLSRAANRAAMVDAWSFLDFLDADDLEGTAARENWPLARFFGLRDAKQWVAAMIYDQLGLDQLLLDDARSLVKHLSVVLKRILFFYGHTGTAVVSSGWPVTLSDIRRRQREYGLRRLIADHGAEMTPEELHEAAMKLGAAIQAVASGTDPPPDSTWTAVHAAEPWEGTAPSYWATN